MTRILNLSKHAVFTFVGVVELKQTNQPLPSLALTNPNHQGPCRVCSKNFKSAPLIYDAQPKLKIYLSLYQVCYIIIENIVVVNTVGLRF